MENILIHMKHFYYGEMDSTDIVDINFTKKINNFKLSFDITTYLMKISKTPRLFSR